MATRTYVYLAYAQGRHGRRNDAVVRLATHVVLTGIALALLGVLLLLSTSVDEAARRRSDLNLRQLHDIDPRGRPRGSRSWAKTP